MWVCMQPTRISSRHKGKRPLYTEPGNSGSDAEASDLQDSDGEGEEVAHKLPKLSQQGTPSQSRRRKRSVKPKSSVAGFKGILVHTTY
jgi:hypothetical protein